MLLCAVEKLSDLNDSDWHPSVNDLTKSGISAVNYE